MHGRICAAIYFALAVALTWPLAMVVGTHVPRDLGDPLLSTWTLSWNAQHLPFTRDWWNAPQFHPVSGSVAFSDHRAGLALITNPVQWAGGPPLAAYNLALLLSFPLSALGAHLLVRSLTGRHDAAFIAGLAFGFNPYRIAHIEHLELLASYWMPVALFALHRYVESRRTRWALLFSAAWLLQSLCSSYYLFYFSVLVVLWLLWFGRLLTPRAIAVLAAAWLAAGLLLLHVLLGYRQIHASLGLRRTAHEIAYFSADIAAIFSASPLLAIWRSSPALDRPEGHLFPGAFVIALVAAAVLVSRWQPVDGRRIHRGLLALGGLFGIVAMTPALFGAWRVTIAGLSASVSGFRKPLSVAAACLALACLAHPRVRAAWRGKSAFAFYVLAAPVLWILSWGPEPRLLGVPVLYQAPYAWLMRLPGFDSGLRAPARFAMIAVLALAIAAGLAFARLVPVEHRRVRILTLVVAALAIAADGWIRELPVLTPPPAWTAPVHGDAFSAVLELPLSQGGVIDAAALFRSISHRHPTVNGFSGHFPPHYAPLRLALERGEPEALSAIAANGPLLVAIHRDNDPDGGWRRYVSQHADAAAAGEDRGWTFFLVARSSLPASESPSGRRLPIADISSSFDAGAAAALLDGDPLTRWVTPTPQRGREAVVIDLSAVHAIHAMAIDLGVFREDFPRALTIDVSVDGEDWTTGWRGRTGGMTVAAVLRDPHRTTLTFPVVAAARYVRLRQTESDGTYYWSIANVAIFGEER